MCGPPMRTLRSGLRACCTNSAGAVSVTSLRARPRGILTRSPSTSAPAPRHSASAFGVVAELDADLLEDRLRVVLDELQALGGHHVVDRHPARDVGHDGRSGLGPRRPARLPAAPAGTAPSTSFTCHAQASCRLGAYRPVSEAIRVPESSRRASDAFATSECAPAPSRAAGVQARNVRRASARSARIRAMTPA